MKNPTGPNIGLHFLKQNSVVIDSTHGLNHFPRLTMQVKSALSQTSAKPQLVLIHDTLTIPQMTTKTITAFVDHVGIGMEYNRDRNASGKFHGNRESHNIPFNAHNI